MNEELAALAAEAAGETAAAPGDTAGDGEASSTAAAVPLGDAEREAYAALFSVAVEQGGNAVCRMARVSPLERGEVEQIASAMLRVAMLYDLSQLDPRSAAWLGLGMTVAGVALNRKPVIDAVAAAA